MSTRILPMAIILVLTSSMASAGVITLGNAIDGVGPAGNGSEATPWVYDFGGTDLDWGVDTASHTGTSWTVFTNIANVTSTGTGGTVDKGGNVHNGAVGDLTMTATGVIDLGGYLSAANLQASGNNTAGGDVTVTGPGAISIGVDGEGFSVSSHTARRNGGDISLYSGGDVTLSGGLRSYTGDYTGNSSSGGAVIIQQNSGGGNAGSISIGGDILTYSGVIDASLNFTWRGGDVTLRSGGTVDIDGNVTTHAISGNTGGDNHGGDVTILANGTVQVLGSAGFDTRMRRTTIIDNDKNQVYRGGDVLIDTTAGNIAITGGFDLSKDDDFIFSNARHGDLTLTASEALATITVGSLDLTKVRFAEFFTGAGGSSTIVSDLLGFDTTNTGGDGSFGNPFITTQTALQADAGQIIYYSYVDGGLNDYLGGYTYRIADASGTAGAGGLLTPAGAPVPEPATLAILGIGGLALAGGGVRRRRRG